MKQVFVFDLDGTLYIGEKPVEGAIDTIAALVKQGYKVFYLTNNSGKTQQQIIYKLNGLGFNADAGNTYCGAYAISAYLVRNKISPVYVIGTDGLANNLISYGIRVENSSVVSAVVVGIDPDFSYGKIAMALDAIDKGAKLIVANSDPSYPVENNRRLPGCGAMVAAIVAATGHTPDFHIGKPNTYMLELICKEHGLSDDDIWVVGDSIESDIAMAINFRCQSILFDPSNAFPNFTGDKIKKPCEIISLLKKEREINKWKIRGNRQQGKKEREAN